MNSDTTAQSLYDKAIVAGGAIIAKKGYQKFKLIDVSRQLGVTHAALYKHFQNRQELLDAINEKWLQDFNSDLQAIVDGDEGPVEKIKKWFTTLYQNRRKKLQYDPTPFMIFLSGVRHDEFIAQADSKIRRAQLESLVKEAILKHEIQMEYQKASRLLFAATEYYVQPAFLLGHSEIDYTDDLSSLLDIVLHGIASQRVN